MYFPRELIMFVLGFISCMIVAYIYEKYLEKKEKVEKGEIDNEKLEKEKQNKWGFRTFKKI